ncbi:hypothetical protein ABK040_016711 [Willaertia magna]
MPLLQTSSNRQAFREAFYDKTFEKHPKTAFFLSGSQTKLRTPSSDVELTFRQESHFFYLTGVNEAECSVLLSPENRKSCLFIPQLDDEYALWCGDYPEKEDYLKLGFDRVEYNSPQNVNSVLEEWGAEKVLTLHFPECANHPLLDKELGALPKGCELVGVNDSKELYVVLKDLRLIKTEEEIEQLRKICKISAKAHVTVMQKAKPGMNERELEAIFRYETMVNGQCVHLAYDPIVAGDQRGATLHYVKNDAVISDHSLLLIDAGAESRDSLYNSDITRTWPINGKFSEKQRQIYQIVLDSQMAVLNLMKPGVLWEDCHRLAERVITEGLFKLGILQGSSVEELIQNHVGAVLFPHGIGHSMGLDVHDPPNRDGTFATIQEPGIRYLRTRVKLEKGMVLTVEPGIYFNRRMIDKALKDEKLSKFINREKIEEYMTVGGIRIEDDVVVTENGIENLTYPYCPKTIEEIESVMAGNGENK